MLYTLSLFVLEPLRWTTKYEWRSLTDLERCALAFYWKHLGESMAISYEPLGSKFTDTLHWLEELGKWSLAYEIEYMVPAKPNAKLADSALDITLFNIPPILRPIARNFVTCLLEPRLQKAMLYALLPAHLLPFPFPNPEFRSFPSLTPARLKDPPPLYAVILNSIIIVRKFIIKHCLSTASLPEFSCARNGSVSWICRRGGRIS